MWIGEVLRRIAGKVVVQIVKKDVIKAAGRLQLFTKQEAGSEAAIHAIHEIFDYTENAFNTINWKVLPQNTECLSPELATFIYKLLCNTSKMIIKG